jgi:hypothetical protein
MRKLYTIISDLVWLHYTCVVMVRGWEAEWDLVWLRYTYVVLVRGWEAEWGSVWLMKSPQSPQLDLGCDSQASYSRG